jgi:hypothetical protein
VTLQAGTRLGPFEILLPLGSGGMGEVYRARDSRLGREVALKVLPARFLSDREGLLRFAQEARSASALNHPNIVTIFEIGHADSSPFFAMELIEGIRLRDLVDAGPLAVRRALDLSIQIADGLAKAHEAGIAHRDLKPENIMVTRDGFVKILDFGLAKLYSALPAAGEPLTQTGVIMGTPEYMSPEQAAGRAVDFRSDQFSLGLILYEMLTRRRVFLRPTAVQTLSAVIQEDPEPLETANPRVPPPLRWAVERCLAKDPEDRYGSTRDLARDLRQMRDNLAQLGGDSRMTRTGLVEGTASAAGSGQARTTRTPRTAGEAPAARPQARRRSLRVLEFVLLLLVGVALFGGGAFAGHWFRGRQTEPPAPTWKGDLLLGTMSRVMAPRVSPDGQALAFAALLGPASHVGVMKIASGDWTVITRRSGPGTIGKVCWSRDGNKIYFDRVSDVPHGIFSVPPLGGEERLVLEEAEGPEALPDGSLLVVKRDTTRNFQLHRFWPDSGKVLRLGPAVVAESFTWSARAFPDGQRALFWGKLANGKEKIRRAYLLDLGTGRATPFASQLPLVPPLSVGGDGRSVLAFLSFGDLQQAISVTAEGDQSVRLFPVTGRPWNLDAGKDGSIYVSTMDSPAEVLRFPSSGGTPERVATTAGGLLTSPIALPDGALLLPSQVLGRRRLFVAGKEGQLRSFLDLSEQATPPVAMLGDNQVAFLSGGVGSHPVITIASISDGRILRRLESTAGATPQALAASPDGRTLFYTDTGSLFALDLSGGALRKLRAGNGVAVDPRPPGTLIVQVNEPAGVRLYRTSLDGGTEIPLLFSGTLRQVQEPITNGAVGPDGRIAIGATSGDSSLRSVALLEPGSGTLERVPVTFDGNLHYPVWTKDGQLLAMGVSIRSSLWRFQPQTTPSD